MDSVCTGTFVSQIVHGLTSYALGLTWQVVLVSSPFLLVSNSSNYGELAISFYATEKTVERFGFRSDTLSVLVTLFLLMGLDMIFVAILCRSLGKHLVSIILFSLRRND